MNDLAILADIRAALLERMPDCPIGPEEMREHLDWAWDALQDCRAEAALYALPALIRHAECRLHGTSLTSVLWHCDVHLFAAAALRVYAPDLAWLCGDRALSDARIAQDPDRAGAARIRIGRALLGADRPEEALVVTAHGDGGFYSTEHAASIAGSMHLVRAIAFAMQGIEVSARAEILAARQLVPVGTTDPFRLEFVPANIALHEADCLRRLGMSSEGNAVLLCLDTTGLSEERKAHLYVPV